MNEVFYHALDLHEAKTRFDLLIHGEQKMEFWNGQNSWLASLEKFTETDGKYQLELVSNDWFVEANEIIGTFKVTAFNYIFRAKVINSNCLELISPLFRSDRRKDERILLQPVYKALAHVCLSQKNVIYLIKGNRIEEDQVELPILDISQGAISLQATSQQQEIFMDKDELETLKITIDGKGFVLNSLSKIYSVPVIDRRFSGKQFYKLGYSFNDADQALFDFIESRKSSEMEGKYYDDFSDFLKNFRIEK